MRKLTKLICASAMSLAMLLPLAACGGKTEVPSIPEGSGTQIGITPKPGDINDSILRPDRGDTSAMPKYAEDKGANKTSYRVEYEDMPCITSTHTCGWGNIDFDPEFSGGIAYRSEPSQTFRMKFVSDKEYTVKVRIHADFKRFGGTPLNSIYSVLSDGKVAMANVEIPDFSEATTRYQIVETKLAIKKGENDILFNDKQLWHWTDYIEFDTSAAITGMVKDEVLKTHLIVKCDKAPTLTDKGTMYADCIIHNHEDGWHQNHPIPNLTSDYYEKKYDETKENVIFYVPIRGEEIECAKLPTAECPAELLPKEAA